MTFPFNEPENVVVFTCVHILEGGEDICYVTHDKDGSWQFLCGQSHNESDARIVSLKEIFDMDTAVGALSDMPIGCRAIRDNKASQWKEFKI